MYQLNCNNLQIGYQGQPIGNPINFSINEGDYICVVGQNGAGKTTLIKTILGLISPIKGTVEFGSQFKQKNVGYLTQQSEMQKDFPALVREIVISGFQNRCKFRPFYSKKEKEIAKKIAKDLEIEQFYHKSYRELSGGQQQRVLLARALCATNEILILDEPTNGLDAKAIKKLYEIINKINKEQKVTIIMISHNITDVIKYTSHILEFQENNNVSLKSKKEYEEDIKNGTDSRNN